MNIMSGKGILKGLAVSLKHFLLTYLDDVIWLGRRYKTEKGIAHRSGKDARGIFTIQYPEEKLPLPEEFRYIPFLVYDEGQNGEKNLRCTSCGICSKVCPPQCIWIFRSSDPATGRPIPDPAMYFIDGDMCMNCGLCAEFCPFDAIKMDHDYELASIKRNIYNKERLEKSAEYYAGIRPLNSQKEDAARQIKIAARNPQS
jgi:NADH-quinone oxidoreductase subunit I